MSGTGLDTQRAQEDQTRIEIVAASEHDRPILANLIQLYVYDFTDFKEWDVREDGRFEDVVWHDGRRVLSFDNVARHITPAGEGSD